MAFDCVMAAAWAPCTQAAVTAGPDVEHHLTGRVGTLTSTAPGPPAARPFGWRAGTCGLMWARVADP